jgi:hypothetical protein
MLIQQKEQIEIIMQRITWIETRIKSHVDILQAVNEQNTIIYEHLVQNATRITNLERGNK